MNPKIAFIILYYGQWPWYWRLWADSVAANPAIEFVIVTDLDEPSPVPANARLVKMPLDEVMVRLSRVIGAPLKFARLHKLCDCKPFYALAFPELVRGYDYWGYCDLDLFFGDLSPLIEKAREGKWDFISPWDYTVGHCNLLRNKDRVNSIALKTTKLIEHLAEPAITFIDEGGLSETALKEGDFTFGVVDDIQSEWQKAKPFLGATAQPGGTISRLDGLFLAVHTPGKVMIYDAKGQSHEVLYFHFMGMKTANYWQRFDATKAREFSFTPYGYEPKVLSPEAVQSFGYRLRCLISQLLPRGYSWIRGMMSPQLVASLKRWRAGAYRR
jgi:hypothetical protein